jgi:hypothetical protein
LRGASGKVRFLNVQIAVRAQNPQPRSLQGFEMFAAREKYELISGFGELGAEVAAHGTRPYDRDTHDVEVAVPLTLILGCAEVNLSWFKISPAICYEFIDGKNRSARRS